MSTHESVVYFMREVKPEAPEEELIKIGVSTDLDQRHINLQYEKKIQLRIEAAFPGTRVEEKKLHALFSAFRVTGEWFRPCPEIHAMIQEKVLPPLPEVVKEPLNYDTISVSMKGVSYEIWRKVAWYCYHHKLKRAEALNLLLAAGLKVEEE